MADLSRIEAATLHFYQWEQRCRGWQVFGEPVELEPMFEPYFVHADRFSYLPKNIDDGKKPTLLGKFVNLFKIEETKEPVKQDDSSYAYPFQNFDTPLNCFRVSLPKGYKIQAEIVQQLLLMISSTTSPVSFEIIANSNTIRLQFISRTNDATHLYSQLKAYFPEAVVQEYPEGLMDILHENLSFCFSEFGLKEEFMRPLKMTDRFDPDPFIGLFGFLEHLPYDSQAAIQILFKGAVNPWSESILQSVSDSRGDSFFLDAPEMVPLSKEKVSSPLFGVVVRVIGQGVSEKSSISIWEQISRGLIEVSRSSFNSLISLSNDEYPVEDQLHDIYYRQSCRLGMLLNCRELATLVHLPSASVVSNKLDRENKKTKSAPEIASGHKLVLGINYHQGVEKEVSVSASQRLKHTHVIGATGTGKSTFITNLIIQDIVEGNGLAVLDPHGDLIETILTHIPENRYGDVIIIDPSDSDYPVGFNILTAHSEIEKEILSSDLVSVFKRLSTSWGDQMNSVLANAILAFLESNKGGTLFDLRRFLIEKPFRDNFLKTVTDPSIIYYWQKEFPLLKSNSIGPILTRLDSFLRPKLIRNMVAQKKGLDFESFLDTGKIVLVKLSQGLIGNENSYLLGTFIVAKIHQAAMARQAKQKDDRKDFYLYIDEFQNFVTQSMSAILSGARKYHLGLILAHQDMQQLTKQDTELASSVLSNAGTRICFRIGDSDAKKLEDGFSHFEAMDLQNLSTGEAIVRIDRPENDFNLSTILLKDVEESQGLIVKNSIIDLSRNRYGTPKSEVENILQELIKDFKVSEREESSELPIFPIVNNNTTYEIQETELYTPNTVERKNESQHRYLQSLIKRMAESRGYRVFTEESTFDGKGRVDVSLERNENRIACEVCVTTSQEWELHNIQKCLADGYNKVVSISTNKKVLDNIQKQVSQNLTTDQQQRVLFFEPESFFLYLDSEISKESVTETRMKGYRVKVEYDPVSDLESKSKQEQILKAITNSIRINK